jgi:hypothetical protein
VRSPGPNQKSDRGRGPFWRLCGKVLRRSGFGFIGWSTLSAVTAAAESTYTGRGFTILGERPPVADTGAVLLRYLRTPTCRPLDCRSDRVAKTVYDRSVPSKRLYVSVSCHK